MGSEVYSKPAASYMHGVCVEESGSVRAFAERARHSGDALIGFRTVDGSVVVNPDPDEHITLTASADSSAPNAVTQLVVVSANAHCCSE